MSCFVCVERRGKTRPSRAAQLQCTEHKSEINRMFIEQLFRGAISASTSTRYRLRADTVRERERECVRGKNVARPRFTTKRDTCRMYRRLPRNGHNSGGLITIAPRGSVIFQRYRSNLPGEASEQHRGIGSIRGIFEFRPEISIRLEGRG